MNVLLNTLETPLGNCCPIVSVETTCALRVCACWVAAGAESAAALHDPPDGDLPNSAPLNLHEFVKRPGSAAGAADFRPLSCDCMTEPRNSPSSFNGELFCLFNFSFHVPPITTRLCVFFTVIFPLPQHNGNSKVLCRYTGCTAHSTGRSCQCNCVSSPMLRTGDKKAGKSWSALPVLKPPEQFVVDVFMLEDDHQQHDTPGHCRGGAFQVPAANTPHGDPLSSDMPHVTRTLPPQICKLHLEVTISKTTSSALGTAANNMHFHKVRHQLLNAPITHKFHSYF